MEEGYITIGTKLDTKKFDQQIMQMERKVNELEKEMSANKEVGFLDEKEAEDLSIELEKAKNKLLQLRQQQEKTKKGQQDINNEAKKNTLSKSFSNAVKQAGKLTVAIFGIRSAYMMAKRASSDLATYDDQYATDLEYIRFVLTQAIAPVLKFIVQLAGTLLQYINAIMQAWFGVSLFANGSAEAFQKMKAGASGTNKAVKELKKQLMGFDEINMLTDQSDTGTSAGAGGVGLPSFNLGEEVELPEWIENNRDIILTKGALEALIDTLEILEGENVNAIGSLVALKKTFEILQEKGVLGKGAIDSFAEAIDMLVKKGIPVGGALRAISDIIETSTKYSIKSLADAERDLKNATDSLTSATDKYIDSVDQLEKSQKALEEAQDKTGISGKELYEGVREGTISYMNMTEEQREVYKAYNDTQKAQENLDKATQNLTEAKKKEKIASLENRLALANEKHEFGEYKNAVVDAFKKGEISSEEARMLINKSLLAMSEDARKTFTEDLPTDIKSGLNASQYESNLNTLKNVFFGTFGSIGSQVGDKLGTSIGDALKGALNYAISVLEWKINSVINLINGYITKINSNPLLSGVAGWIGRIGTISLPRLAVGGIVNMPNRGTMVGGAIAGESGKEGVLPLTDRQAMEELGRTIGKYITVNANIVNTMNGRVISRELKQIQNEQDFVYNT